MSDLILWNDSSALGQVSIESDDGVVMGDFVQFEGYSNYAELFAQYEAAANGQELVEVDRLDKIIDAFAFRVTQLDGSQARQISDLQIGSSRISFRWGAKNDTGQGL